MAKKRKRGRTANAARPSLASPTEQRAARPNGRALPQWRWRTFPVFFAFVAGLLIASIVNPPSGDAGYALQLVALAGFGYGLAHLFVTNVVVAGRLRRRRQAPPRGEEPPEAFEEELVYPDEEAPSER
jgi:hypothetical protein